MICLTRLTAKRLTRRALTPRGVWKPKCWGTDVELVKTTRPTADSSALDAQIDPLIDASAVEKNTREGHTSKLKRWERLRTDLAPAQLGAP